MTQLTDDDLDWAHTMSWSQGEIAAARKLAELGLDAQARETQPPMSELWAQVEHMLPTDNPGAMVPMRHRVVVRAQAIMAGEVGPDGA